MLHVLVPYSLRKTLLLRLCHGKWPTRYGLPSDPRPCQRRKDGEESHALGQIIGPGPAKLSDSATAPATGVRPSSSGSVGGRSTGKGTKPRHRQKAAKHHGLGAQPGPSFHGPVATTANTARIWVTRTATESGSVWVATTVIELGHASG